MHWTAAVREEKERKGLISLGPLRNNAEEGEWLKEGRQRCALPVGECVQIMEAKKRELAAQGEEIQREKAGI